MELLQSLYFLTLGLYLCECSLVKRLAFNWGLILAAVTLHAGYFFGWAGIGFLASTALITTLAELISLKTPCKVFGVAYAYQLTNPFFPSRHVIANVLPIEVPAAWTLLKYLAFFMARLISVQLGWTGLATAGLSASILVAFDLLLDPYAVKLRAWHWSQSSPYFGIPWQNFLGWWGVGLVISWLFRELTPIRSYEPSMVLPVLIVSLIFLGLTIGKLLKMNWWLALLAALPLLGTVSLAGWALWQ